jgi:hypothetical protein
MIRPHRFHPNPETAADNAFQRGGPPGEDQSRTARAEFDAAVKSLEEAGVKVHVFDDHSTLETPDSVFPNNWFSTHPAGHVALYPMYAQSRRRERRSDVIEMLKSEYRVQIVIDYSGMEWDRIYLEGTGAMVLDHIDRVAYVARSNRADPVLLERFCTHFGFEPMAFDTADLAGRPIYHTNVMMCIGVEFALVGLELITDTARRDEVRERLEETGRTVIPLTAAQVDEFAGNAIELTGKESRVLALSARAAAALEPQQIEVVEHSARLLPMAVPTIELAGGSVRCMIAGVHLTPRTVR